MSPPDAPYSIAGTAASAFAADGYAVLRGLLPPDALAPLTAAAGDVYRRWLERNRDACASRGLVNMHSLTLREHFAHAPAQRLRFFNLLTPPALTRTLDAMFGPGLYFHNTQLFFNPADSAQPPYWHRDLQFGPVPDREQAAALGAMLSLHVRIPLVSERGVALIPGTHRRWDTPLEAQVRFARGGHAAHDTLPGETLIDLAPGDVLVFHAQMIHRGHYADNPRRMALDLCIGKPHPLAVRWFDPAVLPDAQEMEQIENPGWYLQAQALVL